MRKKTKKSDPAAAKARKPKHRPNQLFTVSTVSRSDVATMLNEALDMSVDMFHDDDPRLTDRVCRSFAALLHEAEKADSEEEAGQAAAESFLRDMPDRMRRRPGRR